MERKRLTALKTAISSITSGKYVPQPGFEPNYILTTDGARLSRVRVLATVVDKFVAETGKLASLTVDDGTDTIRCKAFTGLSIFDGIEEGHMIDVIGRVREFQEEIFLIPEVICRIEDPNWELLRELEIRKIKQAWDEKRQAILQHEKQASDLTELKKLMKERFGIAPEDVEAVMQTRELGTEGAGGAEGQDDKKDTAKTVVLNLIVELDKGDGCDYGELLEKSGLAETVVDSAVNDLLEEGTCFEPRPGKIKKL